MIDFVVSHDKGATKLNGKLFEYVEGKAAGWLHIGDNVTSDGVNAVAAGAIAVIHLPPKPLVKRDVWKEFLAGWQMKNAALFKNSGSFSLEALSVRSAAQFLSFPIVALLLRTLEEASAHSTGRVFFLSREGQYLHELHKQCQSLLPGHLSWIESAHIPCSRRSLFPAVFATNEEVALRIYRSQYAEATIRAFSQAVLPDNLYQRLLQEIDGGRLDLLMAEVRTASELENIFGTTILGDYRKYCALQKSALHAMLDSKGFFANRVIICDIGWRGTMQEMLSESFLLDDVTGVYLGLFSALYEGRPGKKIGVAFDGLDAEMAATVNPPAALERILTPDVGSTVAYRGSGEAVTERVDHGMSMKLRDIQDLLREEVRDTVLEIRRRRVHAAERGRIARAIIASVYKQPPDPVADIWFDSTHDDTYGLGWEIYAKKVPTLSKVGGQNDQYIEQAKAMSGWASGFSRWSRQIWLETLQ